MSRKTIAYILFVFGVFLLEVHTTIPVVWDLLGLPGAYPLIQPQGFLSISPGFTPPLGALMMLIAGLVYEKGIPQVKK